MRAVVCQRFCERCDQIIMLFLKGGKLLDHRLLHPSEAPPDSAFIGAQRFFLCLDFGLKLIIEVFFQAFQLVFEFSQLSPTALDFCFNGALQLFIFALQRADSFFKIAKPLLKSV